MLTADGPGAPQTASPPS